MDLGDDDPPQRRKPICNMSIYLDKYGWYIRVRYQNWNWLVDVG